MKHNEEFRTKDFYSDYKDKDKCDKKRFEKIVFIFFQILVLEILNGFHVKLPYLGIFKMRRINTVKQTVDYNATNQNKKNGIDKVVYRTTDFYFAFDWNKNLSMQNADTHAKASYTFKPTSDNLKEINRHRDILEISYV